jgi:hypothetical protein
VSVIRGSTVITIAVICIYVFQYLEEVHTGFWLGNLREENHLEEPGVDGRIISNWIFEKWDGGHGLDRSGSR